MEESVDRHVMSRSSRVKFIEVVCAQNRNERVKNRTRFIIFFKSDEKDSVIHVGSK